jgi:serine/threonine protein kinase
MGYMMGCPNRIDNPHVYALFKEALNIAVNMLHRAGVLHGDLYLSNVMWKQESDEKVCVKIVDWDAAHCLDEEKFVPKALVKLVDYLGKSNVQFGVGHDLLYLSVLDIDINEANKDFWPSLASQDKDEIDGAFKNLLYIVLEEKKKA